MKKRTLFITAAVGVLSAYLSTAGAADASAGKYKPTWESLEKHSVPEWFHDVKFGIFIHWGVYSVPGWAPKGNYAEWYPRNMYKEGSPTYQYHVENYGDPHEFTYKDFAPMFKAEKWDPDRWADLFEKAGAKYVVPVGEHHDGFPMWDSDLTEYDVTDIGPKRDIIGELAVACRERGMKYAPSYHRMMNYYDPDYNHDAFSHPHYSPDGPDAEFVKEWKERWEELRDKYKPDLIWFDGDWMASFEVWGTKQVVADYYNVAEEWGKEVAVNDRLGKVRGKRGDFYTQEYEYGIRSEDIIPQKWESCRGIGSSFGYNKLEGPEDYASADELVDMLIDIVSKNGNLLLDIGPKADGTIPAIQKAGLLAMGEWLDVNGQAIYATRTWNVFGEGDDIRFTRSKTGDAVYAICLEWPGEEFKIKAMGKNALDENQEIASVRLLGSDEEINWKLTNESLEIEMPEARPCKYAFAFKIQLRQ